jgi:hypothetical protein
VHAVAQYFDVFGEGVGEAMAERVRVCAAGAGVDEAGWRSVAITLVIVVVGGGSGGSGAGRIGCAIEKRSLVPW